MQSLVSKSLSYFLIYCVLATAFYYILGATFKFESFEAVWIVLLTIQLLVVLYFMRPCSFKTDNTSYLKKNADVFVVFSVVLLIRILMMDMISVWLDEEIQAFSVMHFYPTAAGTFQHQPPLDMLFTKIGLFVSGTAIWGLRLHTVIFSSLSAGLLYFVLKQLSRSIFVACVLTLFFVFHRYVVQYGFEARPISLGLFSEIIFLSFVLIVFKPNSEDYLDSNKNSALLMCSTFLYLSSLGMQPVFIVAVTLIFLLGAVCFKRKYLKSFLAVLAGFVLFLPLQFVIFEHAAPRIAKFADFSLSRFLDRFTVGNFSFLSIYFNPWGYLGVFSLIVILFRLFKKKNVADEHLQLSYCVFVLLFFCGILIPFFTSHVDWKMQEYYLISVLPVLFLKIAILWNLLPTRLFTRIKYLKEILFLVVTVVGVRSYSWATFDLLNSRDDIKGMYKFLEKNATADDAILSLCFGPVNWTSVSLRGEVFYRNESDNQLRIKLAHMFKNSTEIYSELLVQKKPVRNVFFLYYINDSDPFVKLDGDVTQGLFQGLQLYKVAVRDNDLAQSVIDFLTPTIDLQLQNKELYAQAMEYLVRSYEFKNDLKNVRHYVQLYEKYIKEEQQSNYLNQISERLKL